jgi:2-polyprenyl-3-methyl-5-hydroxy-6-metoxy-1,4-benzoquinol methylase
MSTTVAPQELDEAAVEAFAGRMFMDALVATELFNVELGLRLGLYEHLRDSGALTSAELADAGGVAERYSREWLEQQAASGVLEVDDVAAAPEDRRFSLPAVHAHVLLERDSEAYMAPAIGWAAVVPLSLPLVVEAFRTGGGVPYSAYEIHDIQAGFTRPVFVNHLATNWLPAMPDVHARLGSGSARVAEIGCGEGVGAIQIALAYPGATVDGFDLDDASIAAARKNAAEAGVADRVRFEVCDATTTVSASPYDLVLCIEMLHDVPDPAGILKAMGRLAGATGTVLVIDERAAESFTAPGDEMERFFYAASVLHCLPVGMTEEDSAGTGTVIRPATVRQYAADAGFGDVEILPVEHPQFRLYRLRPAVT